MSLYFFPFEIVDSPFAIAILSIASLIVLAIIIWADQYENEPKLYLIWAFLWGGLVASTASGLTYSFVTVIDQSILLAAFAEEFFKFIGIFIAFKKYMISWWTDGLVFGSMIGLGFTVFEDLDYVAYSANPLETAIWRSLGSVFAHSFFSGVFGALFVFFLIKKDKFLASFAFTFAGLSHYIWNFSSYFVESWWAYIVVPPLTIVSLAYFLRKSERDVIKLLLINTPTSFKFTYPPEVYFDLNERKKFLRPIPSGEEKKNASKTISKEIHEGLVAYRKSLSPS